MKRPNILVIMSDQHSRHALGCYGNPIVRTPNMDRLAAQGMVFDNAYCPSPLCVPSRMSFMTGRTPSRNRVWTNQHVLGSAIPTWAHYLGAAGYDTALVGRMHFVGTDQLHGFAERPLGEFSATAPGAKPELPLEHYPKAAYGQNRNAASIAGHGTTFVQWAAGQVTRVACRYLHERAGTGRPFAAVVGYYPPHSPYIAPKALYDHYLERVDLPEIDETQPASIEMVRRTRGFLPPLEPEVVRRARAAYFALCEFMDRQLGTVLDALEEAGLVDDTLVVYTSDHGDMAGEHGLFGKSVFYEGSVGIPMIARLPGQVAPGQRRSRPCSLVDLGPTLVELAGAGPMERVDGRSLVPALQGRADDVALAPDTEAVVSEVMNVQHANCDHPARMVRLGRYKVWVYPAQAGMPPALFDLETDPREQHDLADDPAHAERLEHMVSLAIDNWDYRRHQQEARNKTADYHILQNWGRARRPASPHGMTPPGPELEDDVRIAPPDFV